MLVFAKRRSVPLEILITALGAFLGALLSLLASIAIEYQRKPQLQLSIESPPLDRKHSVSAPAGSSRFVRVHVTNRPMPRLLSWLGRAAANQCTGDVQFFHLDDGAPVFSMPARWAGSDEPFSYQLVNKNLVQLFDPVKYNAAFRRTLSLQSTNLFLEVHRSHQNTQHVTAYGSSFELCSSMNACCLLLGTAYD